MHSIRALALSLVTLCPAAHAQLLTDADFSGLTVGSPPPTAVGSTSLPLQIDAGLSTEVAFGGLGSAFPGRHLLINEPGTSSARFVSFDNGIAISSGAVRLECDLAFDEFDGYTVLVRNGNGSGMAPAAQFVMDLDFTEAGTVLIETRPAGSVFTIVDVSTQTRLRFVAIFDLDQNDVDVFLNGDLLVSDQAIRSDYVIGRVGFGFTTGHSTADLTGELRVDNILLTSTPEDTDPCSSSDRTLPWGELDFSDVIAFLNDFSEDDESADLAAPIGVIDFNDVVAFLIAFSAGCP